MSDPIILPPELDPRGPRRPPKQPRGAGGRTLGPLGVTAAVLSVCVLAASGFLYNRYLHYNHNLSRINGAITTTGGPVTCWRDASNGAARTVPPDAYTM